MKNKRLYVHCLRWGMLTFLVGCNTFDSSYNYPHQPTDKQIAALQTDLLNLTRMPNHTAVAQEAQRIAEKAIVHAKFLAQHYRVYNSPRMHNTWVNIGLKERGLCYHFAHDLKAELVALQLQHFHVIDIAARHHSQMRAHYAIAVGLPGLTFGKHIVLDAWRDSGQLFWSRVEHDKRYPWALWKDVLVEQQAE